MGLFAIKNTLKVPSWFLCMLLLVVTSFRVLMSKNEVELKRKRNKVNLQQVSARWLLTKERFSTEFDLRSDGELFLQRPTIKSSATLGDCSFALTAPTLWNELSASHGDTPYQLIFKVDFQSVLRRLNGSVQNVDPLLDPPSGPLVDPLWTHIWTPIWTPFFLHPVKKIIAWQMLGTLCVKGCRILKI